jgi:hypothetical protein
MVLVKAYPILEFILEMPVAIIKHLNNLQITINSNQFNLSRYAYRLANANQGSSNQGIV